MRKIMRISKVELSPKMNMIHTALVCRTKMASDADKNSATLDETHSNEVDALMNHF